MAVSSNGGVVVESGSEKGMFSSLSFSFLLSCIRTHNNPTFSLTAMKRMQHHSFFFFSSLREEKRQENQSLRA